MEIGQLSLSMSGKHGGLYGMDATARSIDQGAAGKRMNSAYCSLCAIAAEALHGCREAKQRAFDDMKRIGR